MIVENIHSSASSPEFETDPQKVHDKILEIRQAFMDSDAVEKQNTLGKHYTHVAIGICFDEKVLCYVEGYYSDSLTVSEPVLQNNQLQVQGTIKSEQWGIFGARLGSLVVHPWEMTLDQQTFSFAVDTAQIQSTQGQIFIHSEPKSIPYQTKSENFTIDDGVPVWNLVINSDIASCGSIIDFRVVSLDAQVPEGYEALLTECSLQMKLVLLRSMDATQWIESVALDTNPTKNGCESLQLSEGLSLHFKRGQDGDRKLTSLSLLRHAEAQAGTVEWNGEFIEIKSEFVETEPQVEEAVPSSDSLLQEDASRLKDLVYEAKTKNSQLQRQNLELQKNLSPMLQKKQENKEKRDDKISDAEMEKRYFECLSGVDHACEQLRRSQAQYDRVAMDLQSRLDEKEYKATEIQESFAEFKREIAKGAENSRTGKPIPRRVITQFESSESKKDQEVEKVRLKNINLKTHLRKLEQQLRAKEQLAEGLHLIDFEQLKIENQTLNEKIDPSFEGLYHCLI